MPSITQLEYILAVHETKSFSQAADKCHVSQPSLSAQILKAEDELDIVLFDRSKKPIATTVKGHQVVEQIKNVLREYKKIYDVKNDSGVLRGDFNLGIIPTLASNILPLFVESFSKAYPELRLKINEYKTDDIVKALYNDELDAGLLVTPLYDDKIVERPLFLEPFFVFASKGHELYDKKTVSENDLDACTVWLLEEGHCFRDQVIKVCSVNRKNNVLENINFSSGSLETLINLIRRGDGFTLLPELSTLNLHKKELEHNLKRFRAPVPTREVSLVHSRSFLKQEVIFALEDKILDCLPPQLKSKRRKNYEVIDI